LRDHSGRIVIAFSDGHTSEKVMQASLQTGDSDGRRQLADVVAERIERLIVDGVLKSGRALPSERRLTEKLGVSRTALREGLKLLRARGNITGQGFVRGKPYGAAGAFADDASARLSTAHAVRPL
jgi:prepilin-type processing-associated H-X9-DG protein